MIDLAVETGIPDLATNVDSYLYGHPKAAGSLWEQGQFRGQMEAGRPARASMPGLRPKREAGEAGSRGERYVLSRLQPAFRFPRSPGIDARTGGYAAPSSPRIATASSSARASMVTCSGPSIMMRARGSVPL